MTKMSGNSTAALPGCDELLAGSESARRKSTIDPLPAAMSDVIGTVVGPSEVQDLAGRRLRSALHGLSAGSACVFDIVVSGIRCARNVRPVMAEQ